MPNLRLVEKGEVKIKRWKVIVSFLVITLSLAILGFQWYASFNTPMNTAKTFVKAVMNGNEKTLSHLNYTGKSVQKIKEDWTEKLKGYKESDLVLVPSDTMVERIHVTTKDKKMDLWVDINQMNNNYFITYTSP